MAVQRALRRGNVMVRKTRSHVSKVQLTSETLSRLTTTERRLLFDMQRAQLVELPEGLILVKEEVRVLKVHSTALSSFPTWIEELVSLEKLELRGQRCISASIARGCGRFDISTNAEHFRLQQTQGTACTSRRSGGAAEPGTQ